MRIAVCLKEVPARDSRYRLVEPENWIDEAGVSFEISECDEYALEEALKLKERHGGEVILYSVGTARVEKILRKGLAMGADRATLVEIAPAGHQSPYITAALLAQAIAEEGDFDLILCGTQSDDLGYAQTGVLLAEFLDLPHATLAMELELLEENIAVTREMESGRFQKIELPVPALLTIQAGISPVRFVSLKGIMQARKKEIRRRKLSEAELENVEGPRLEIARLYEPEVSRCARILTGPDTASTVRDLFQQLENESKVL